MAAALASAATGTPPPAGAAFVGEVALTGLVRPAPAIAQRFAAARAAGCSVVFAPEGSPTTVDGLRISPVRHVREAVSWAFPEATGGGRGPSA